MAENSEAAAMRNLVSLNPLDSQIYGGSSHPLSLPSQPLDIRNWFSSYEYESEETSNDASETQDPVEVSRKRRPEDPTAYTCLSSEQNIDLIPNKKNFDYSRGGEDDRSNCNSSKPIDKSVEEHKELPIKVLEKVNFREQTSPEEYPREATIRAPNYGMGSELAQDISRQEECAKDGRSNAEALSSNSSLPRDLLRMPSNIDSKLKREQNLRLILGEDFLGNYDEVVADGIPASPKRERSTSKDELGGKDWRSSGIKAAKSEIKQQEENNASNGFISTKNRESARENDGIHVLYSVVTSDHKEKAIQNGVKGKDQYSANRENPKSEDGGKGRVRSPLGDRTNFRVEDAEVVPDLSGKWRCPRKSKPYVGPPMKQLRLERWVHRTI